MAEKDQMKEPEIKIEDILEDIGGYGKFQKIFSLAALFPQMTAALIILSPVFTGSNKVPLYCSNKTAFLDEFTCLDNCTEATGEEVYSSIVQEWDLVCSRSWIVDTATSCQMAGMMTGSLISSLIADKFGRIKGYFFVTFAMGTFGMMPALATSPIMYAVMRYFAGFGMGGCFIVYVVHLMEFLTPSWRTICGAVSLWPIGEMLLGLISYHVPNWRYLTVITGSPVFLVLSFLPFIQESPRWLLTQRRTREAHEVLRKIARWNSRPAPQVATIDALQDAVLREEADVLRGLEGVRAIFRSRELRKHLAILVWSNISCAIIYYGVSFSAKSLSGSPHWNMLFMGILDLLAVPAVLAFNNRIGRKKTFFMYMVWTSTFMVGTLILSTVGNIADEHPMWITIFALLGRLGIVCCWGALSCIIMESFPTQLRSSCLGFIGFTGYLGGIVAPQTIILKQIALSAPYILYGFLSVTSAILCLFLREMAGRPLRDTVNSKY